MKTKLLISLIAIVMIASCSSPKKLENTSKIEKGTSKEAPLGEYDVIHLDGQGDFILQFEENEIWGINKRFTLTLKEGKKKGKMIWDQERMFLFEKTNERLLIARNTRVSPLFDKERDIKTLKNRDYKESVGNYTFPIKLGKRNFLVFQRGVLVYLLEEGKFDEVYDNYTLNLFVQSKEGQDGVWVANTRLYSKKKAQPSPSSPVPSVAPSEIPTSHTVKSGETLGSIAQKYGLSWKEVQSLNRIDNPNKLRVGQILKLK